MTAIPHNGSEMMYRCATIKCKFIWKIERYGLIAFFSEVFHKCLLEMEGTRLPSHVTDEFESLLDCGILSRGFIRFRCEGCKHERIVPLSCKKRGFCSICGGRCCNVHVALFVLRFDNMRRSAFLLVALIVSSFRIVSAHAEVLCFDLNKRVMSPLMSPIALNEKVDTSASGEREGQIKWGAVRGVVQKPISQVLKKLLDPRIIKGPEHKGIRVISLERPSYLSFQELEMTIHPLPFISISWKEMWEYVLLEGSLASPKVVLISFQKTEGTSHIKRFCGSILLKAYDPQRTDIFLYEEIKAARRSKEDIVAGHYGTLAALRTKDVD